MKINELHKPKEINQLRDIWNYEYQRAKEKEPNMPFDDFIKASASRNIRNDIVELLGKYGFEKVGEGLYGQVFINPNHDYALKVFRGDSGYVKWIDFCRNHQDNPYIPKIKGKIIKITPNIFAIRMEKLEKANYVDAFDFVVSLKIAIDKPISSDAPAILKDIINFLKMQRSIDLNQQNVMQRSDGHIVITDPLAG